MVRRVVASLVPVLLVAAACGGPGSPVASATALPSNAPAPSAVVGSLPPSVAPASPAGSFTCTLPLTIKGTAAGAVQASPTAVRIGKHTDFDRIAFEYSGTVLPSLEISAVNPPFTRDPSGLPLTVSGASFVRIRLEGVRSGAAGRTSFLVQDPELTELARQGDFEAVQTWIAGLVKPGCVHLSVLSAPARLVIDLAY